MKTIIGQHQFGGKQKCFGINYNQPALRQVRAYNNKQGQQLKTRAKPLR